MEVFDRILEEKSSAASVRTSEQHLFLLNSITVIVQRVKL